MTGAQASNSRFSKKFKFTEPDDQGPVQLIYELSTLVRQMLSAMIGPKRIYSDVAIPARKSAISFSTPAASTCVKILSVSDNYSFADLFLSCRPTTHC